ncbi:MotA/TolQ/ExbB proton channel family protein [Pseudoalteromonas sp. SS15]|uniref:MotA/TolQ/ExbB proton channel family protein n=1 Tax=Pseudoalteromonas sp. SS15 TaxID=3139393 RepID=UPI003BA8507B
METLFIKGGIFMWPLLTLLVVSLIILVERSIYWIKVNTDKNLTYRTTLLNSLHIKTAANGIKDRAIILAEQSQKKKILYNEEIENHLKSTFMKNNRFMRSLDVITSVAPLFGILGTIWGIISSFNLAGSFTDLEPATAMVGMAEAFITTAFGLIVSLFSLFTYSYFQSISEKNLVEEDMFLTNMKVKLDGTV